MKPHSTSARNLLVLRHRFQKFRNWARTVYVSTPYEMAICFILISNFVVLCPPYSYKSLYPHHSRSFL